MSLSTLAIPEPRDDDTTSALDSMRAVAEDGVELWSAREVAEPIGYDRWENFAAAIKRGVTACETNGRLVSDHFREVTKMVELGSGARRAVTDYLISWYGMYLTLMNADARKPAIAAAQEYFAVQTRRQELADAAAPITALDDDEVLARGLMIASRKLEALTAKVQAQDEALDIAQHAIAAQRPSVEAYEAFIDSIGTLSMAEAAQTLTKAGYAIGRQRLYDRLRAWGLITMLETRPTQRAIERGWMTVKVGTRPDRYGNPVITQSPRLTGKGFKYVAERLRAESEMAA